MGKEGLAQTESRPVNNHSYSYRVTVTVTVTQLQTSYISHSRPYTYHTSTCTHKHSHAKMPVEYNHACLPTHYTCGYSYTPVPQDCSIVTQTIHPLLAKPTN